MDWRIEVIPVPVTDVDRARSFYEGQLGFVVDLDDRPAENMRIVQLTPPGSACSIQIGTGTVASAPGSLQGVQIVVDDVAAARARLVARGVECSPIRHFEDGRWVEGAGGRWNSFVFFEDPDGNGWILQERPATT